MNPRRYIAFSLAIAAALIFGLVRLGAGPRSNDNDGSPLVVYCAAGLFKPAQAAAAAYWAEFGVPIQIEPGPSGKLLSQLKVARGQAHLFISSDIFYLEQGQEAGVIGELLPIADQHPVLIVQPGNPKYVRGLDDLLRSDVKLALANPELAAVGRSTKRVLQKTGHWAGLEKRAHDGSIGLSFTGTVSEVAQAVRLGAADAGIVWDSLAGQFELPVIPVAPLSDAKQQLAVGVVAPNKNAPAARAFARYLSARGKGLVHFERFGFHRRW